MLKELFSNRLFIGALAFFVLCVVGGVLYISHVEKQGAEELATDEDRVKQVTEKQQPQPTAEVPVRDTSQGGHFHEDGTWHGEPRETPPLAEVNTSEPVQVSDISAPQTESDKGAGNPHPWEHVPVDLYDFEATKAAMIENINFVKANWHPFEYKRDVSIAYAITANIANAARATQLGLFTPEQALELTMLYQNLLRFKDPGGDPGRVRQLEDEGYSLKRAIEIAAEETTQRQKERWGVK